MTRFLLIATGSLLFTGCGSLLETKMPVSMVYVLNAAPAARDAGTPMPVDIAVSQPTAAPGLDTERIAVLHEARRLDYYQESQWGVALPQVAQSLLVGSLQNQKLFHSVTTEQARVSASYLLDLEVRDFQAEYTSANTAPTVRVTLVGALIRIKDRKLIGVLPATFTVNAAENKLSAVIAAFESAAQQAALSLGQQTASTIKSNQ